MAQSAFEEPLVTGSGSKLTEGQKYVVELTDIVLQKKCVKFREALRGKKGADGKSIINKEYDALSPDMKELVDTIPAEMWPLKDGETTQRPKDKFADRITFQFVEPESGVKFLYDAQFDVPSTALSDFVARASGIKVDGSEGYTWGNIFPKGSKFVGTVIKKGNFLALDVGTLTKEQLNPIVAPVKGELSDTAKALLDYIKTNLVGQSKTAVFDLFDSGKFGDYTETAKAWTEIQRSGIKVSADGKIFGGFE